MCPLPLGHFPSSCTRGQGLCSQALQRRALVCHPCGLAVARGRLSPLVDEGRHSEKLSSALRWPCCVCRGWILTRFSDLRTTQHHLGFVSPVCRVLRDFAPQIQIPAAHPQLPDPGICMAKAPQLREGTGLDHRKHSTLPSSARALHCLCPGEPRNRTGSSLLRSRTQVLGSQP